MKSTIALIAGAVLVAQAAAFAPVAGFSSRAAVSSRGRDTQMLFGLFGGKEEEGDGMVELTFNEKKTISVAAGSKLSDAAAKAGVRVRYDCKEGKCGICAVRINGKQVRTCITKVPKKGPLAIVVP
jgi:ferredoxin